jgi:hypothetical protein
MNEEAECLRLIARLVDNVDDVVIMAIYAAESLDYAMRSRRSLIRSHP